ncbi:unnamed protein product [Somion occarium]|uniref:Uncharacterized protein n=1 Tax=Somion occarium TaxID=3059160 RepID=A0ABP1DUR2_9APHY
MNKEIKMIQKLFSGKRRTTSMKPSTSGNESDWPVRGHRYFLLVSGLCSLLICVFLCFFEEVGADKNGEGEAAALQETINEEPEAEAAAEAAEEPSEA